MRSHIMVDPIRPRPADRERKKANQPASRRKDDLHQITHGELTTAALWAEMSQNGLGNRCSKAE